MRVCAVFIIRDIYYPYKSFYGSITQIHLTFSAFFCRLKKQTRRAAGL